MTTRKVLGLVLLAFAGALFSVSCGTGGADEPLGGDDVMGHLDELDAGAEGDVADRGVVRPMGDHSLAAPSYRVLGYFEAHVDVSTGEATLREIDHGAWKSGAVPDYDDSHEQNRDEGAFSDSRPGTFRFEQDSSGNGQTVAACEAFWTNGWGTFGDSWRFWVPVAAQSGWLLELEDQASDNRFCTNFRIRNDLGRAVQELWIVVDGFTNANVRALQEAAPRVAPAGVEFEPDVLLEPNSVQGMFEYGTFAEGETVNRQWYFYFGTSPVADFRVRGRLVEIIREVCGNGLDDNGDGFIDNGCED